MLRTKEKNWPTKVYITKDWVADLYVLIFKHCLGIGILGYHYLAQSPGLMHYIMHR